MYTRFAACLLATVLASTTLASQSAHAQSSKALMNVQGKYKFGMTVRKVCLLIEQRIKEKYADKISGTTDPFVQDKLRKKMRREYARIGATYVRFTGKAKGWDVSIIDKEFGHKSRESMLYWEDDNNKNNRRFFFFFRGKLYKTLTALDMSKLRGDQREFAIIQRVLEKRFGKGKVAFETNDGIKEAAHLDWYQKGLWVRASDKLRFYNTFIIAAVDRRIWKQVVTERAKHVTKKERNNLIKAIVAPDGSKPDLDENSNVIKDLTRGNNKKKK